jgi:hypothetical protein
MVGPGAPRSAAPYLRDARGGFAPPAGTLPVDNILLLSMLAATVAVPAWAARMPDGRRALARMLLLLVVFTIAYAFVVTQYYATHFVPEPLAP